MLFIDIKPSMHEGFLEIFNQDAENGDIYFNVAGLTEKNRKNVSLKMVCKEFESSGYGMFSFAYAHPILKNKVQFEVLQESGEDIVAMQLAPFLGLPGENVHTELLELKDFLTWVKDLGFKHPDQKLRLVLDAFGDEATFKLSGVDEKLMTSLNEEMFKKIEESTSLVQWVENQKVGILATKENLHVFDLIAKLPVHSLMTLEENEAYMKLQPPKITPKEKHRKNRFRK